MDLCYTSPKRPQPSENGPGVPQEPRSTPSTKATPGDRANPAGEGPGGLGRGMGDQTRPVASTDRQPGPREPSMLPRGRIPAAHPDVQRAGLLAVAQGELDRARTLLASLPPPTLSPQARDLADKSLARWRRVFSRQPDDAPPVTSPRPMLTMLSKLTEESAPVGKDKASLARAVKVAAVLEAEGWHRVGPAELFAARPSTFYKLRATAIHSARRVAEEALEKLEALELLSPEGRRQRARLVDAMAVFEHYPPDAAGRKLAKGATERADAIWPHMAQLLRRHPELAPPQRSTDQQLKLRAFNRHGGRERFWETAKESPHAAVFAVALCCGARPIELARGVAVSILEDGSLRFLVDGAKVVRGLTPRDQKGQEWRETIVAPDAPEARWLASYVRRQGGSAVVAFGSGRWPTLDKAAKAFGDATRAAGRKAFPQMKQPVSPYVFRHLYSAEVKRQGSLSQEELAQALGHLSGKTMQHYGSAVQASHKGRGPTVMSAWAPSPVRHIRPATSKAFVARF